MDTKKLFRLLTLVLALCLLFTACGGREEDAIPEESIISLPINVTEPPLPLSDLGLTEWTLSSTIWSSANGATVDMTATPSSYQEGMSAAFVVRLEGEELVNKACQWDGKAFTAFADLNAADGYCYYVVLTGADGSSSTIDINTPNAPFDEALIDLEASLESFCHAAISDAPCENGKLTILEGTAQIRAPRLTTGGQAVTCTAAELVLNLDGGAMSKEGLNDKLADAANNDGTYDVDLSGITFSIPEMEGDHQLSLTLVAYLSDGTTLTGEDDASWFYTDGVGQLTVG